MSFQKAANFTVNCFKTIYLYIQVEHIADSDALPSAFLRYLL